MEMQEILSSDFSQLNQFDRLCFTACHLLENIVNTLWKLENANCSVLQCCGNCESLLAIIDKFGIPISQ